VQKGIPTMVLAAASLDDIISICGFGVSFNLAFSQLDGAHSSSLTLLVLNAPISIASGFAIGFLGAHCQYWLTRGALCLSEGSPRDLLLSTSFRAGLLLGVSVAVVFLLDWAGFSAGGYLAVMVQACVLASLWGDLDAEQKEEEENEEAAPDFTYVAVASGAPSRRDLSATPVSALFKSVWTLTQPALFVLIGAQVLLRNLSPASLRIAALILASATTLRIAVTFLSVSTSPVLSVRERLFICVAWLPKATVQAALGSLVLDAARELELDDDGKAEEAVQVGELILTLAVLAILVTAPIGAMGIFVAGPRWLERKQPAGEGGDEAMPL
jgi:NhaP-type Na+/H+ or K+/H+ antiporter